MYGKMSTPGLELCIAQALGFYSRYMQRADFLFWQNPQIQHRYRKIYCVCCTIQCDFDLSISITTRLLQYTSDQQNRHTTVIWPHKKQHLRYECIHCFYLFSKKYIKRHFIMVVTYTMGRSPSWEASKLSQSNNYWHFMESKDSLPHLQVPAQVQGTCICIKQRQFFTVRGC